MNHAKVEQWAGSGFPTKKDNMVRHPSCKFNPIASKFQKPPCLNPQLKSPKCFIKISGSRYNGTFLLNIDDGLDDTIYHTMRDIEVALEDQVDPMGKQRLSPKNCLSSVFRCFGTSELDAKVVCNKKKKKETKDAECSLTATINKSDIGPIINAVQANSYNSPDNSNENVMRDVVDVFRDKLDQFCKEIPSTPEVASVLHLETSQHQFLSRSDTKTETRSTNPSREDSKKVTFIRFSPEEVLVIQPPKPLSDSEGVEVVIEVKPKTTATNVGQSIKLAKDKVLIGVQDGRGVLQISDQVPKRTLQMVIEEGGNGKPSMKLSLNEETPEKNPDCTETIVRETPEWSMNNHDCNNICKGEGDMVLINHFNSQPAYKNLRSYKSVESQVSWAHLKASENIVEYRSSSTQYDYQTPTEPYFVRTSCVCTGRTKPRTSDANVGNDTDESQVTCIEKPLFQRNFELHKQKNFRKDRLPYFVHTLYEPRSLNSSSCFVSDEPSIHCFASTTNKSLKPRKSITFSSDHSNSSKYTKIFRGIGEISAKRSKPLGSKDAGMTTNLIEDFEKVLQNMCGSNYLYHNSEQSIQKQIEGVRQHEQSNNMDKPTFGLSFDQWTQTDNQKQYVQAPLEYLAKYHKPKEVDTSVQLKGKSRPRDRSMIKRSKSNASRSEDGTSVPSFATEEEPISDSSDGIKPNFGSTFESPSKQVGRNRNLIDDSLIYGKAKSSVGQTIFAAIEERTIDPDLFNSIDKSDSFIYPACKDKSGLALNEGGNISVVNMALYQGPGMLPLPDTDNDEVLPDCLMEIPQSAKLDRINGPCVGANRCRPIRLKCKSCQNLSTATRVVNVNQEDLGKNPCTNRQQIKLRYPQLTKTDSCRASNVNVCGILNLNEGEMKTNQPVKEIPTRMDYNLPSAIKQLLLPRQRSAVIAHFDHERSPTYYCDDLLGTTDYWEYETFDQIENEWYMSNEAAESMTSLALRKSLFKKTSFAMKTARTAVGKTFCTLLRKLSFSDTNKKKMMPTNDRLVYVAIPLEKKRESLRLTTQMQ